MPRYIYRSAKTGRFVSRAYAEANPDTTVKEQVRNPKIRPSVSEPVSQKELRS